MTPGGGGWSLGTKNVARGARSGPPEIPPGREFGGFCVVDHIPTFSPLQKGARAHGKETKCWKVRALPC